MIYTVNTSAALKSVLATAQGGDTIQLASGTYPPITVDHKNFASEVIITSMDPNAPAVLTGLTVSYSSNIAFQDLELQTNVGTEAKPFTVGSSHDIRMTDLDIHGTLNGNPQDDRSGLTVRNSDKITIEDSTFHELNSGIGQLDNTNLVIRNNTFDGIQADGIRGGGSSWVTISGNFFTNFWPEKGDHPDAVQFWTSNTTVSQHDITIVDNVYLRGDGQRAQGIFLGNELGIAYKNVFISGNLIAGSAYNAIYVYKASDVTVTNNTVIGFSDEKSFIQVSYADKVLVSENASTQYRLSTGLTNLTFTANTTITQATDGGAEAYAHWLADHSDPVSLLGDAGANVLTGTSGADTLNGGGGADTLTGGAGDDLYIATPDAKITELAGGGIDTIRTNLGFTLPDNVENIVLTGNLARNISGNALDNSIIGNAQNNRLRGQDGSDTLDGRGGSDSLTGGAGADVFVFQRGSGNDVVSDFGAGGEHDTLDISAFLAAGLKPTVVDLGADVRLTFTSGETIVLTGIEPGQLHATTAGYVF